MAKGWPFRYEPCPQMACASGVRSLWQDHISIFVALLPALHLTRLVDIRAQGGVWRAGFVSLVLSTARDLFGTFTSPLPGCCLVPEPGCIKLRRRGRERSGPVPCVCLLHVAVTVCVCPGVLAPRRAANRSACAGCLRARLAEGGVTDDELLASDAEGDEEGDEEGDGEGEGQGVALAVEAPSSDSAPFAPTAAQDAGGAGGKAGVCPARLPPSAVVPAPRRRARCGDAASATCLALERARVCRAPGHRFRCTLATRNPRSIHAARLFPAWHLFVHRAACSGTANTAQHGCPPDAARPRSERRARRRARRGRAPGCGHAP